jgi:hypothetical protein
MMVRTAITLALLLLVLVILLANANLSTLATTVSGLSAGAVVAVVAALTGGTLLASVRLKAIAKDFGYRLSWRDAFTTLTVSQLAGALFLQVVGQLIARGILLSRVDVPVSATIVLTTYERIAALVVSVVLAAAGGFHIFGKLTLNLSDGGATFLKISAGLLLAVCFGASIAWGPAAARLISGLGTKPLVSSAKAISLSLAIQFLTMAAYVIAAKTIQPEAAIADLCAASTIIMLAASLPISLAGWGIRELSAIVALGAIGVGTEAAVTVAVLVGAASMTITAALAFALAPKAVFNRQAMSQQATRVDYAALLDWVLPLAIATAVFFQIFVPLRSGIVNVNLADPIAVVGGVLFLIRHLRTSKPQWRMPNLNGYILLTTLAFVLALISGIWSFGLTDWAFTNKFVGWFMLLAYGAVGASLVHRGGEDALQILLLTFAATAAAVVALEIALFIAFDLGAPIAPDMIPRPIEGFSQNRNSFSFLLLVALAATFVSRTKYSVPLGAMILIGLWFAGSRAALGTLVILLGFTLFLRIISIRTALATATAAIIGCAVIILISAMAKGLAGGMLASGYLIPVTIEVPGSNAERFKSMSEGFAMFMAHPIFGAGLGAYMHDQLSKGVPLVIHSTPIWLAAELGVVGLGLFAWVATRIFLNAWRWQNASGALIVLVLVVFAVMSAVHELLYQRSLWLLLGAALAAAPNGYATRSEPAA